MKKGIPYQKVVAEVVSLMNPKAQVEEGIWVAGPDGSRELDVCVKGIYKGERRFVLIECKDYDPKSTGSIGIGVVDAFESKIRDLGCDLGLICSNAGFTKNAIRKAARVGIGLISVLKMGDKRIRYKVKEEVYTRRILIVDKGVEVKPQQNDLLAGVDVAEINYDDIPLENWIINKIDKSIFVNPIVSGSYRLVFPFDVSLELIIPTGKICVTEITIKYVIQGGWFSHSVIIDSTSGFYNWLSRRIDPSPGNGQMNIQGIDFYGGKAIKSPPAWLINKFLRPGNNEMEMQICMINGLKEPGKKIPNIDKFVSPEDLNLRLKSIPKICYTTDKNFKDFNKNP